MEVIPVDLTALVATIMGLSILLVPVIGYTARSALKLIASPETDRLKICPNCEWLFIDRSKNRSRTWCDMAVCGNRAKARLHYHRKRKGETP